MYGLLNRAIKDLVETTYGAQAWVDIAGRVSPDALDFIAIIVRETLKGTVKVSSTEGIGTRYEIRFPMSAT